MANGFDVDSIWIKDKSPKNSNNLSTHRGETKRGGSACESAPSPRFTAAGLSRYSAMMPPSVLVIATIAERGRTVAPAVPVWLVGQWLVGEA